MRRTSAVETVAQNFLNLQDEAMLESPPGFRQLLVTALD